MEDIENVLVFFFFSKKLRQVICSWSPTGPPLSRFAMRFGRMTSSRSKPGAADSFELIEILMGDALISVPNRHWPLSGRRWHQPTRTRLCTPSSCSKALWRTVARPCTRRLPARRAVRCSRPSSIRRPTKMCAIRCWSSSNAGPMPLGRRTNIGRSRCVGGIERDFRRWMIID